MYFSWTNIDATEQSSPSRIISSYNNRKNTVIKKSYLSVFLKKRLQIVLLQLHTTWIDVFCSEMIILGTILLKALNLSAARFLLPGEELMTLPTPISLCLTKAEQNKDSHSVYSKNQKKKLFIDLILIFLS